MGDQADRDAWRARFTEFYLARAPERAGMVDDAMMDTWAGRYDVLWGKLQQKYGQVKAQASRGSAPDQPDRRAKHARTPPPSTAAHGDAAPPSAPSGRPAAAAAGRRGDGDRAPVRGPGRVASGPAGNHGAKAGALGSSVADWHDDFVALVAEAAPARPRRAAASVVDAKAGNAVNGLETSTFTVCTRIRPVLRREVGGGGDCFTCVVPGAVDRGGVESALALTPKVTRMGQPELDPATFRVDYCFGPDSTAKDIFESVGRPLVERAKVGQVGVVFAYGQTGSGKTHTMNGLMDDAIGELFDSGGFAVTFSYFEVLGKRVSDCLGARGGRGGPAPAPEPVQIGEALDGRVLTRGLSVHPVTSRAELEALVGVAKARRATAATARNQESSRSHGVAVITVALAAGEFGDAEYAPAPGALYIIDLAGSESTADSRDHDKARFEETKEINLSLMSLKECIRARTKASEPGGAHVHVPYRRSKLTLFMKDVFDIGCARLCSTVVVACVSPLARDVAHSSNTLKYAAPLRVAVHATPQVERDARDPAMWAHEEMCAWLGQAAARAGGALDAPALIPGMRGVQVCALPEVELFRRVQKQVPGAAGATIAKGVYNELWTLIVDAKTRRRRPDGTIISEEQEAAEVRRVEESQAAKSALWAKREAQMAKGF